MVILSYGVNCVVPAATSSASWIDGVSPPTSFAAPQGGQDTLNFAVEPNPYNVSRTGTVSWWGYSYTIIEDANPSGVPPPPSGGSCPLPGLDLITDPDAQLCELVAPNTPSSSLHYPDVLSLLDVESTSFENQSGRTRTSGYRPLAYQSHLYNIKTTDAAYNNLTPSQQALCTELKVTLDTEIAKHGLIFNKGVLAVNPPTASAHSTRPATALDYNNRSLSPLQLLGIDAVASNWGLYRPCMGDTVHYQLKGTGCTTQVLSCIVQSPINVIITDPSGRRIGFDSSDNTIHNDLGTSAYYSGPSTEPQY
jgi:hypothetical protein